MRVSHLHRQYATEFAVSHTNSSHLDTYIRRHPELRIALAALAAHCEGCFRLVHLSWTLGKEGGKGSSRPTRLEVSSSIALTGLPLLLASIQHHC